MRNTKKMLASLAMAAGVLGALTPQAEAAWPNDKPVTIVVGYTAGSGADVLARIIADGLSKKWNAQFLVENRAGAAGGIGQGFVAKAAPDGYTFVHTSPGPAANNMLTYKSLPYNPMTDFVGVAQTNETAMVLVAGPKAPAQDIKGMLDYIAKNPGKVTAGHPGLGTYGHMTELAIAEAVKSSVATVPYKGTSQIIPDLLAGQIDLSCDQAPVYVNMHKSGQVKVIAVIADERSPLFPEVPTLKEAGINFTSAPWYGMQAPKGTPKEIVDKMNAGIKEVLFDPANKEKIAAAGYTPKVGSPADFDKLVKDEVAKWEPIIKKYNITAE